MSGQIAHRGKADVPTIWTVREDRVNRRAEVTEAEDGYDVIVAVQRYAVRGPPDATIAVFDGRVNGQPFPDQIDRDGIHYRLAYGGRGLIGRVDPPRVAAGPAPGPPQAVAPPG